MLDLYDEFRNLIEEMNRQGVPYALCGGLAMAVHGYVRATIDIDLLVPEGDVERAKAVCIDRGFSIEASPMVFAQGKVPIERMSKVDPSAGDLISVDLLVVTEATRPIWSGRVLAAWEQIQLSVVSREGLMSLKKMRGSGTDLDDIAALERGLREN